MGSGKSTLGRRVAERLNWVFWDLDKYIEEMHARSVSQLFESQGEEVFRQIEAEALRDLIGSLPPDVFHLVACGGGTPCYHQNIDAMKAAGVVFYLDVPVTELVKRLCESKVVRPVLRDVPADRLQDFIQHKLQARMGYYQQAHYVLQGDETYANGLFRLLLYRPWERVE